jgi:hypothetical protein
MTITNAVCTRLLADPALRALVGSHVYQLKLPQQPPLPAVLVWLVTEPATYHFRGTGLSTALVQVDSFAHEYDVTAPDPCDHAWRVAEAVDQALSGAIWIDPAAALTVRGCFRSDRRALYVPDELRLVQIVQEYRVTYGVQFVA